MTVSSAPPETPYVGPRPIPADRVLYGRDHELRRLMHILIPERLVLLYSPSGAGKTSLIQAALLPALREKDLLVRRPIRVNLDPGMVLTDHAPVNRYVLSTLLSLDEEPPDGQPGRRRTPEELAGLDLATYLEQTAPPGEQRRPEVLIFDQFEEIITLDPIDLAAKSELFRQVGVALRDPWRWALFAMREDHIAALDAYLPLLPTRLRARFRLDLLAEGAARQAIQQPAADAGYTFTDAAADKLLGDLLEVRLPRPSGGPPVEARGHYVEPVQLQVVCLRIWNHLQPGSRTIDLAEIEQWGNVDTALGDFYHDSISKIAAQTGTHERLIRDWIEEQLTTPDGLRFQVVEGAGRTEGLNNAVLTALEHAHLVRREHHRGVRWYELTHDRLVRAIREANAAWRVENLTLLEREAAVWHQHGRRDDLLVGGAALEEMERLAAAQPHIVREAEQAFLDECREKRAEEARQAELEETRRRLHEAERAQEAARLRAQLVDADLARARSQAAQAAAEALQAELETRRVRLRFRLVLALVLVAVAGVVVALLLGGVSFYLKGEKDASDQVATARLLATQVEPQRHRRDLAMLMAAQAYRIDDSPETRGTLLSVLVDNPRMTQYLRGHRGGLNSVAVSPDGRLIATGSPSGAPGVGPSGEVMLWDTAEGRQLGPTLLGHGRGLAFSPDGRVLASGRSDGSVSLWDVTATPAQGTTTLAGAHTQEVTGVQFSTDGRRLASASADGTVAVWDVAPPGQPQTGQPQTGQPQTRYSVNAQPVSGVPAQAWGVAFDGAADLLATGTNDGRILVWNVATGQQQQVFRVPAAGWVRAVIFAPDGDRVLAGGANGTVRSWDTRTGSLVGEVTIESRNTILTLALSPDGSRLAAAGADGRTTVWDVTDSPLVHGPGAPRAEAGAGSGVGAAPAPDEQDSVPNVLELTAHTDWVWGVAFGPDSRTLVTASVDQTAIVWDMEARWGRPLAPTSGAALGSVALDPNHTVVAAAGGDGRIRLWDRVSRTLLSALQGGHQGAITSIVFSNQGHTLISGGVDRAVVFWDWQTGAVRAQQAEHSGFVVALAVSQDGHTLASVSCAATCRDTEVLIWDVQTARVQRRLVARGMDGPSSVALSPDGQSVVAGIGFSRISQWNLGDAPAGQTPAEPTAEFAGPGGHKGQVRGLSFSPDGQTLASSSVDGRIILWDVATRKPLAESLIGTGRTVWGVAYQPGGMLLAIANGDGTVSLRDARSGDRIGPFLRDHGDGARSVAFTSDGAVLASAGLDGRVILWDTSPEAWVQRACHVANRNLTMAEWRKYLGQRTYQQTCPELPAAASGEP